MINKIITKASIEYFRIKQEVLASMQLDCDCNDPGFKLECKDCSCYMDIINEVQSRLYEEPSKECIVTKSNQYSPRTRKGPYSQETIQNCLELYSQVKSIKHVAEVFAVSEGTVLRWLKEAGMHKDIYGLKFKEDCIQAYKDTNVQDAAEKYDVKPITILRWAKQLEEGKLSERKIGYSQEIKEEALKLYQELKTIKKVCEKLGVGLTAVSRWLKEAGVKAHDTKYSQEEVDNCLSLYATLNNANEVSRQTGISNTTIKNWVRKRKDAA